MKDTKLIAKFIGTKFHERSTTSQCSPTVKYIPHISELKYHKSWDSLMPVVQSIYQFGMDNELTLLVRDAVAEANLDNTYKAVVDFIKWYNKNN